MVMTPPGMEGKIVFWKLELAKLLIKEKFVKKLNEKDEERKKELLKKLLIMH